VASILDILLLGANGDVHVWALPNVKGQGRESWTSSRVLTKLEKFAKRKDAPGYGVFFCVSPIVPGQKRLKQHARGARFIHADVDFKDIDLTHEEIEANLRGLVLPPSRMHHTGNGIHCFWIMDEVSMDYDRVERLLRMVARHVGGDPTVAHRVALLRMPGTHNSKRGEWTEVRVIKEGTETYTLDELDAWLVSGTPPVMHRRNQDPDDNPFLRRANEQGYKAPVDVEARLVAMIVGGDGETSVHNTQLSCTASLTAMGVDEDDAVALILDATKTLPGTDGWDWRTEETELRKMCADARKKFKMEDRMHPVPVEQTGGQSAPQTVVSLDDAREKRSKDREERKEKVRTQLKKKNEHIFLGEGILEELALSGQRLMYTENQAWLYSNGIWESMPGEEEKTWINVKVERGCRLAKMVSTSKIVNETRQWLQRNPELHKDDVEWDAHGGIATRDGLYDWRTDTMRPLEPEDYATRMVDAEYDADAECPVWEEILSTDYGFDEGTVQFLQELLGVSLIARKPRTLKRALTLLGPSNTGKSNIIDVFAGIVSEHANVTELKTIENSHGLMSFLKPHPWVLHEAFDQSRWEMSATVKALLSGDPVSVNVKNGPLLTVRFDAPVFWGTNVPPQFREASRAMENRLAIVKMKRAFNPMRLEGNALKAQEQGYAKISEMILGTEKTGVLQWAIDGLVRAMTRGHFVFTEEMTKSLHAMRTDSNMATGFVEACCEFDPDAYINTGDFYGAFTVWHRDHKGGVQPTVDSLGRAMSNLSDPRVLSGKRISHSRVYCGLKLNDDGMDNWNAYQAGSGAERSGLRISGSSADVNKVITPEAAQAEDIRAMQEAHRTWAGPQ